MPQRPRGALDALASRAGILFCIGCLVAVCVAAAFYTQTTVTQLRKSHEIFLDRQISNSYVAMSDVQRLLVVVQKAVDAGAMTPELEVQYVQAADILFVRAGHLRGLVQKDNSTPEQAAALEQLTRILEIADAAIANDFRDIDGLIRALLEAAEAARGQLVRFLEAMRLQADEVMLKQARTVSKQQLIVLLSLASLTMAGCIALVLLRLEIIGRRAREKAEQRVQYLAFFDSLTGLANRVQFQDHLQALLHEKAGPVALLAVDLDEFKSINDTLGHAAGDAVLCRFADILKGQAVNRNGLAARLAGDEFALVLPSDDQTYLERTCRSILEEVRRPFHLQGETLSFTVSIGLASTTQVSKLMEATPDALSRVADFALYASKSAGRNRFTVYDETLEAQFSERRAMIEELPRAIENGDLEVYLQPKVRLADARVYGFEALARWQRGDKLVQPEDFIKLAEETGLVVEIDNYILNHAARIIAEWNERHGTEFSVSVNLSTLHFNSQRVVQWVEHALWRSDIRPDLLVLEITESTEMRDWAQARAFIAHLRRLGCKFSIDDFGTGYSSLAYLKSMPADELKIDRSLVEEIETSEKARSMLGSVFEIAQTLELALVVEGIETQAQARIVREMGAASAQGFLFGYPERHDIALAQAMRRMADSAASGNG